MSKIFENSIWPNGLKTDSDGYVTYLPLGSKKVNITEVTWPEGDKFISPYVYKIDKTTNKDKIVALVDTSALTVSKNSTITLNYSEIDADFSSIVEGTLTINAPNASEDNKKFTWHPFPFSKIRHIGLTNMSDTDKATFKSADKIVNNVLYDVDGNITKIFDTRQLKHISTLVRLDPNEILIGDKIELLFKDAINNSNGTPIIKEINSDLSNIEAACFGFYDCKNLTSFNSNLKSLKYGQALFAGCDKLTTFNANLDSLIDGYTMFENCESLDSFNNELPNLTNAISMFSMCTGLTSFDIDLPNVTNAGGMFSGCTGLTSFDIDLPNVTDAHGMFALCSSLTSFDIDLPNVTDARSMFVRCTALTSFNSELPNVTNAGGMFSFCSSLTSFDSELPNVTEASGMFSSCSSLTSFDIDLPNVTNASNMFSGCTGLTSFSSSLNNVTNALGMFLNCKLDTASVVHIANSLPSKGGGHYIHIGIGNTTPNTEEDAAFKVLSSKGYAVYVNGSDTIYDSSEVPTIEEYTEGKIVRPYYAKPVEVAEEDANYFGNDGKFYLLLGGQFIYGDDLSTYGIFTCEEHAANNMRLTKIERN